jgi:steroid delta-isomerase-like uncharacterized protein
VADHHIEAKALVRRVLEEVWNTGDVDILDDVLTDDYVRHGRHERTDKEHMKATITLSRNAFPDLHTEVRHMLQEGDTVATRWKAVGTHQGAFYDLPITRKKVIITGMTFSRIFNGKVAEEWESWCGADLFQDLGVVNLWEA